MFKYSQRHHPTGMAPETGHSTGLIVDRARATARGSIIAILSLEVLIAVEKLLIFVNIAALMSLLYLV